MYGIQVENSDPHLGGTARTARLRLPFAPLKYAWIDNAPDRDQSELTPGPDDRSVELAVKPHAIITLRLLPQAPPKVACGPYCKPPS
jgi:hypothetical protein